MWGYAVDPTRPLAICSMLDRRLARKYGLSDDMLQNILELPLSHKQSTDQVREIPYELTLMCLHGTTSNLCSPW